jgi:glycosyltransferase involved in cell wall biosynthesis
MKYIREYGWSPFVLTVRGGDVPFDDPSLNGDIPANAFVYRTLSFEPVRFAKRMLRRRPVKVGPPYHLDSLRRLIPWAFPDRRIGWVPFAIATGMSVLRSHPIDIIYSTYSDTISAHVVAYALKVFSGTPWVADFQDPWSEPYVSALPSPLHRSIARHIEQTVFKTADHVIFTTNAIRETYGQKYRPAARASAMSVIPNGFDPEHFQRPRPDAGGSSLRIVHFGVFWGSRSPGPFLMGLAHAIKTNRRLAADIEVAFVGGFEPRYRRLSYRLLAAYQLEQRVRLVDPVSYLDGVDMLAGADVLLLVLDNTGCGKYLIPCKLFDYLAAGKPILALAPEGETARILRAANAGTIVDPDDVSQIAGAIVRLHEQWREGSLRCAAVREYVQQFSYRETTKSFVSILNGIMEPQVTSHAGTGRA